MEIRDKALQKLKTNKSENNISLYKKFRNRIANELKEKKPVIIITISHRTVRI